MKKQNKTNQLKRELSELKRVIDDNNELLQTVLNCSEGMPENLKELFDDRIFLNTLLLHDAFKRDINNAYNEIIYIKNVQLN